MKIELPSTKVFYKVTRNIKPLKCRNKEKIIIYTMIDLYKPTSIARNSGWGSNQGWGTPARPTMPRTYFAGTNADLDGFLQHIGQRPPYIKKDADGDYVEFVFPKDMVFQFSKITWKGDRNTAIDNVIVLDVPKKPNVGVDLSFLPLVMRTGTWSNAWDKKHRKVDVVPSEFSNVEFELV